MVYAISQGPFRMFSETNFVPDLGRCTCAHETPTNDGRKGTFLMPIQICSYRKVGNGKMTKFQANYL